MDWEQAKDNKNGTFQIPGSWIHISHYEALNILFRMENALRIFVYCVLKESYGSDWVGLQISTLETESIAIGKLAARRISQQQDFAYLGKKIACPMMYLNSGELIHLIFADKYWPKFAPFLEGKKEILRNKLEEISTIRNSLAHFRPVTQDEVDVIRQNTKHVFRGIEACLREITSCSKIVPTNTQDDWYKELSTLGNELCKVSLYESPNGKWVRMEIQFSCMVIGTSAGFGENSHHFELINLSSPEILQHFGALSKRVIFVSEYMPRPRMPDDRRPSYRKQVSLMFSAKSMRECYKELSDDLKNMLTLIIEERDLISNDHLARGRLLEVDTTYAWINTDDKGRSRWVMQEDKLLSSTPEDAPPEYWGTIGRWPAGFIDTASRYPWMPSAVSSDEFPF
jgi:hypothetical protein